MQVFKKITLISEMKEQDDTYRLILEQKKRRSLSLLKEKVRASLLLYELALTMQVHRVDVDENSSVQLAVEAGVILIVPTKLLDRSS